MSKDDIKKYYLLLGIMNILINSTCDIISEDDIAMRMFGGTPISKKKWPFLVSVTRGNIVVCDGSLIHVSWVITAAHCIDYNAYKDGIQYQPPGVSLSPEKSIIIVTESESISPLTKNISEKHYTLISQIITETEITLFHPGYKNYTKNDIVIFVNDIALLKLSNNAVISDYLRVVHLAQNPVEDGTSCMVSGWSINNLYMNLGIMVILYELTVIVHSSECEEFISFKSDVLADIKNKSYDIFENIRTARTTAADEMPYSGKIGGPLICDGLLQGISSTVIESTLVGDHRKYHFTILSDITNYHEWILKIINTLDGKQQGVHFYPSAMLLLNSCCFCIFNNF